MHPHEIENPDPQRLIITWQDGSRSLLAATTLRRNCPCVACRTNQGMTSGGYLPLLSGPSEEIAAIDLIGSRGLTITFADGHARTIFPWELLRRLAPPTAGSGTTTA